MQARIGAIGLRDFLFRMKVLGLDTLYYDCGEGRDIVEHLVVWCPNLPRERTWKETEIRS